MMIIQFYAPEGGCIVITPSVRLPVNMTHFVVLSISQTYMTCRKFRNELFIRLISCDVYKTLGPKVKVNIPISNFPQVVSAQ